MAGEDVEARVGSGESTGRVQVLKGDPSGRNIQNTTLALNPLSILKVGSPWRTKRNVAVLRWLDRLSLEEGETLSYAIHIHDHEMDGKKRCLKTRACVTRNRTKPYGKMTTR
jgi:hypothetical protein